MHADFDLPIPTLSNQQGEVILGLQNAEGLTDFINLGISNKSEESKVCRFKTKDHIDVLC